MIELIKYNKSFKSNWDDLVHRSKNGTFLFLRDYMDYHSDRFIDNSYIVLRKGKIEGIIPGNINGKTFYSHQGLTYGGLIISNNILVNDVLLIFDLLIKDLKNKNVDKIIWKPVPHIYHTLPSEEEIYALFRFGAEKIGCAISSTIFLQNKIKFIELRKRGVKKAQKNGIEVRETKDYNEFWQILTENLESKYGTKPVHSLEEIQMLSSRFTENIKLYAAQKDNDIIGGLVMYVNKNVAHVQYIAANEVGKNLGALDFLFDYLINNVYKDYSIFDFGYSTENMGKYLNENLIFQKEGFGGRGIVYQTYKISI